MKLSNFVFQSIDKSADFDVVFATVDVITNFWLFERIVTKEINTMVTNTGNITGWKFTVDDICLAVDQPHSDYLIKNSRFFKRYEIK